MTKNVLEQGSDVEKELMNQISESVVVEEGRSSYIKSELKIVSGKSEYGTKIVISGYDANGKPTKTKTLTLHKEDKKAFMEFIDKVGL